MASLDLFPRQSPSPTPILGSCDEELATVLDFFKDPFASQLSSTTFYAALVWSFGVSSGLFLLFLLLRPRTSNIYAPRAKHADPKHKPPTIGKGLFSWIHPIRTVKEAELVEKIGLDATIFLRFLSMFRNIFVSLAVVGCAVLIPIALSNYNTPFSYSKRQEEGGGAGQREAVQAFMKMTPQYIYGNPFWAYVVVAWAFTLIIFFFVWWNYRAVTKLRRLYFESADYRHSLHSRTLMLTQIPSSYRNEDGVIRLIEKRKQTAEVPKASVGRSLRGLPEIIEEHEKAVLKLESILAKYLADPNKLPSTRPTCKPDSRDKEHKGSGQVDAIDYYTRRIQYLEHTIKNLRESVDQRNPLPYGFASYTHIEDAHAVAYATRNRAVNGAVVRLAPKPTDILWKNLPMSRTERSSKSVWNGFWIVVLTIAYIPPNILVAVFLVDLRKLGLVWCDFQESLYEHPTGWSIVQGILAPLLNVLFYLYLPMIFRRLLVRSGDTTKTSRERHVTSKLYAFIVFNNLFIFSVLSAATGFIWGAVTAIKNDNTPVWDALKQGQLGTKIVTFLISSSPYWIAWQLQRNLSAAIDIVQAWPLVKNTFLKKFSKPTPRELVKITAPQNFDYAEYYYLYLFVATVGLSFGLIQPLLLAVTAFYFAIDVWLKKYLLQYIFITKVESGGSFWRMLINRIFFATILMNAVVALLVGVKGKYSMLYAMAPLVVVIPAFKIYCMRVFDSKIQFYTTKAFNETEVAAEPSTPGAEKKIRRAQDRVGVKYGHPALYQKLITPMVHAKSQHLLSQVYGGRLGFEEESKHANRPQSVMGYSDIYMSEMDSEHPGKMYYNGGGAGDPAIPFEMVNESELDFEYFKRRSDFRYQFGGDGELYGRPEDSTSRPTTPSSMMSLGTTTLMGRDSRRNSESIIRQPVQDYGESYARGYAPVLSHRQTNSANEEGDMIYHRGYAAVEPGSRDASPHRMPRERADSRDRFHSPPAASRQPTLPYVDLPSPNLGSQHVANVGAAAYHEDDRTSSRLSMGSMGGMLQNAAGQPHAPTPQRRPVGAPSGRSSQQHHYRQSASGGGSGTLVGSPSPYEDTTSYDYFRRGPTS